MQEKTRVSLQYGITLDELPEEVERLSKKITKTYFNELSNLLTRAATCHGEDYVSNVYLDTISRIRECVGNIDAVASDIESIVSGYIEMENSPNKQLDEEADTQASDIAVPTVVTDIVTDNTAELVEQMRLFREKQTHTLIEDEQKSTKATKE